MTFDQETLPFLRGEKFSNSLKVPINYHDSIPDRVSFLVNMVKGKTVIHLGCLDHRPLIEEKIKRRQWLHKELTDNAASCIGVDVDNETAQFVQDKFGFKNIFISDFTREQLPQIIEHQWEFAILGELLEHIDNPVEFLSSIKRNYSSCIRNIVITVPNAWTQTTFRMASQGIEIINSDHRYWFTPYTLSKVLFHSGIEVKEIFFANRVPLSKGELISKRLQGWLGQSPKYNFTYASSIVAVGTL